MLALTCHSVLVCSSKLFPQWHWERELIPQWYEGRVKADAEMPTTHLTEVLRTLKSILASFKFFVRPRLALTSYCTLDHLSPYLVFFFFLIYLLLLLSGSTGSVLGGPGQLGYLPDVKVKSLRLSSLHTENGASNHGLGCYNT